MITVVDIFGRHAAGYLERFGDTILPSHARAIADITTCGTEAMGAALVACDDCGGLRPVFHCCRNRLCPTCHTKETKRWLAGRALELFPVGYHHVIFTVPWQLRDLSGRRQRVVLSALMRAAAASLQELAADPRFGGGRLGILSVLHTWSSTLLWHPHVHCLVPGIVVGKDGTWQRLNREFLVPVKALSPIFRAKFAAIVRRELPGVRLPKAIWEIAWNVRSRPCVEGPGNALRYLGRYVFSGPMSGRRILGMEDGRYILRYRDNETRKFATVRLAPDEFLRRYLQHALPHGFHRIRYFGWWAPACRSILHGLRLQLVPNPGLQQLIEQLIADAARFDSKPNGGVCPFCGCTRYHVVIGHYRIAPELTPCRDPPAA